MRLLFDQGVPLPLRRSLPGHDIETAFRMGWATLANGDLLAKAEDGGFDALVTTGRNLKFQQRIGDRRIAVSVLTTTSWPRIRRAIPAIRVAIDGTEPGTLTEVSIP